MLEVNNLTIEIGTRKLLEGISFTVQKQDKLAIIGEEGNGKSTLMKAIYNMELLKDYAKVSGSIMKKGISIGYLEQMIESGWEEEFIEHYFVKERPEKEIEYEKYNELYRVESVFQKLGLDPKLIEEQRKIKTLSGGEKVKIQLAKILMNEPDLLLLDEPTNDIDIDTLEWMEDFIKQSNIPIVYISHDEVLLERTANCILHLEQVNHKTKSRVTFEHVDYLSYIQKRQLLLQKQEQIAKNEKREYDKQVEKYQAIYQSVEYQQEHITRQNPSGGRLLKKKMKSVKSMEKRIVDKELTQRPEVEEQILAKFHNEDDIHSSKVILDMKLETLQVEDKILKQHFEMKVVGKEKVAIVGKNGSGKSTFLKQIYEELKQRKDIKVGYMPQNYDEFFKEDQNGIEFLKTQGTKEEETLARTYLASMKFTQEEITGNIQDLSGGQKAKLYLVKLMMDKSNVLLLDEPTRNLSPLSNPVIRRLLKEFNGAIISVSHDRKYIEEVCDRVYPF